MNGRRPKPVVYTYNFPVGSYTWTCPESATYKFVVWGAGGGSDTGGNTGGGSGALYIAERFIARGQTAALVVGVSASSGNGTSSTVTLPSGEVLTAGGGQSDGTAGTVTANTSLDIVYAGSAGGTAGGNGAAGLGDAGGAAGAGASGNSGGAGAPGYGTFRGGDGQAANISTGGESPAAGKGVNSAIGNPGSGGHGLILIVTAGG